MLQQVDYSASWPIHDFDWRWVGLAYFQDTTADIYMDLKLLSERLHYRSSTSFVFVLFLSLPIYRERTIIGLVSYLYRYWQYRIGYCCIGRYYVHHCRFINCWRVALHTMIKGWSSTRHPHAACARVRAVLWSMIRERVGGKGGGNFPPERDCVTERLVSGYKDGAVLVLATITLHSLHQQEVITTVHCQTL